MLGPSHRNDPMRRVGVHRFGFGIRRGRVIVEPKTIVGVITQHYLGQPNRPRLV
jgi:hypothetical protein